MTKNEFDTYIAQMPRMAKPFAWEGDKRIFANESEKDTEGNDLFPNYKTGIPPIYARDVNNGGKFVERQTSNGIGFLASLSLYLLQVGKIFTYDSDFASAIGGYPPGATLWWKKDNKHYVLIENPVVGGRGAVSVAPTKQNVAPARTETLSHPYYWREVSFTDNDVVTLTTKQTITGEKTISTLNHPEGSAIKTNMVLDDDIPANNEHVLVPLSFIKKKFLEFTSTDSYKDIESLMRFKQNVQFWGNVNVQEGKALTIGSERAATEQYVKTEIAKLQPIFEVVDSLPTTPVENTVYMIRAPENI